LHRAGAKADKLLKSTQFQQEGKPAMGATTEKEVSAITGAAIGAAIGALVGAMFGVVGSAVCAFLGSSIGGAIGLAKSD